MEASNVQINGIYIFDKYNRSMLYEGGINLVVVKDRKVKHSLFGLIKDTIFEVYPLDTQTLKTADDMKLEVYANMLEPISVNPMNNVIIRYPSDMPIFNDADIAVIEECRSMFESVADPDIGLAVGKIKALETKIRFYAELAKQANNGLHD